MAWRSTSRSELSTVVAALAGWVLPRNSWQHSALVFRTSAQSAVIAVPVQANKELVRKMIDQVWNAGRLDRLPEFWSDETWAVAEGFHQRLTEAFPDLHIQIEGLVAEADQVVARLTFEGTHRGRFRGTEQDAFGLLQQLHP